jgi:hypothetical protein
MFRQENKKRPDRKFPFSVKDEPIVRGATLIHGQTFFRALAGYDAHIPGN